MMNKTIEDVARAIRPHAFRELSRDELMANDNALTEQLDAQGAAREDARRAIAALRESVPGEMGAGDTLADQPSVVNMFDAAVSEVLPRVSDAEYSAKEACERFAIEIRGKLQNATVYAQVDKRAHVQPVPDHCERMNPNERRNNTSCSAEISGSHV